LSDVPNEVEACFRLISDSLNVSAVSAALGLVPSHAHEKGELRVTRTGPLAGHATPWWRGVWLLYSERPSDATIQEHLDWLLQRVEPNADQIREWVEQGMKADFSVSLYQSTSQFGYDIGCEVLARMVRLGASFGVSSPRV
jgi:hypothetical protein